MDVTYFHGYKYLENMEPINLKSKQIGIDYKMVLEMNQEVIVESFNCTGSAPQRSFIKKSLLIFITIGNYKVAHGKRNYWITSGEMTLLQNSMIIEYKSGGAELSFLSFSIKKEILREFIRLTNYKLRSITIPLTVTTYSFSHAIETYIESVKNYLDQPKNIESYLMKIKMLELSFMLAESDSDFWEQLILYKISCSHIIPTIEAHMLKSVSINDLAAMPGKSLSSFKRDFYAIYNMPALQWIREKKLSKAKEFVRYSSTSIKNIRYIPGFESTVHFSRLFKSDFGNSPSDLKPKYQIN